MAFRFQRRVSIFPGVRLNFSTGGISTTIGVRGAGVTIGRRGTYLNVGIPGSGLSFRTRLDAQKPRPSSAPSVQRTGYPDSPDPSYEQQLGRPLLPGEGEIASGPISEMTSPGLNDLKKLINEADSRRAELQKELAIGERKRKKAERRLRRSLWLILRLFSWSRIPRLRVAAERVRTEIDVLHHALDESIINIDFDFDEETLAHYAALQQAFENLSRSNQIWDVAASYFNDMFRQRTTAGRSVDRKATAFRMSTSEVISARWEAMRFGNVTARTYSSTPALA